MTVAAVASVRLEKWKKHEAKADAWASYAALAVGALGGATALLALAA